MSRNCEGGKSGCRWHLLSGSDDSSVVSNTTMHEFHHHESQLIQNACTYSYKSIMYAVKIEVNSGKTGEGSSASSSGVPSADAGPCSNADVDEIQVSVGNPRVEHVTGIVHLYRQTHGRDEAGTFSPKLPVQARPPSPFRCTVDHSFCPEPFHTLSHRSLPGHACHLDSF